MRELAVFFWLHRLLSSNLYFRSQSSALIPVLPVPQVTPVFGMYFLQAELTMNECARKRRWTH